MGPAVILWGGLRLTIGTSARPCSPPCLSVGVESIASLCEPGTWMATVVGKGFHPVRGFFCFCFLGFLFFVFVVIVVVT